MGLIKKIRKFHTIVLIFMVVILTVAFLNGIISDFLNTKPQLAPASSKTQLANPASVNCEKQGGTLVMKKNGAGGEYGLCVFEDNMACEEWALFRGECPVGGVKTTGYDNVEQMYCAWLGGKTLAVENATCTLPSGKTCGTEAVFNGLCGND